MHGSISALATVEGSDRVEALTQSAKADIAIHRMSGAPADVVRANFGAAQRSSSVKLAASIAHVYGKSIVAAESFTAAPSLAGGRTTLSLKTLGDLMYCRV